MIIIKGREIPTGSQLFSAAKTFPINTDADPHKDHLAVRLF
jgi:hypothetical protein